jgi:hypothetical protein
MLDGKVVRAHTEESLARIFLATTSYVIVSPNPSSTFPSWLCDHAAPQKATREDEVIACGLCYDALSAGAQIAYYACDDDWD